MNLVIGIVMIRKQRAAPTNGVKLKSPALIRCALRKASAEKADTKADQGRVLLERDEVVHQGRDHTTDGLRDHDRPQGLPAREPQCPRRRGLARVDDSMPAR